MKSTLRRPLTLAILTALCLVIALCQTPPVWAQTDADHSPHTLIGVQIEDLVKSITLYLARFVEVAAATVIGIASLRALWAYFVGLVHPNGAVVPKEEIRLSLGRSLALALEFELGADILKTAVAPTWNDIGQLAAIAVLRTALNYFLGRELEQAQQQNQIPDVSRNPVTLER